MAAVAAGMLLGILESFSIWIMPTAYKDVISIAILLLILFVRPSGLFGSEEAFNLKEF
jgi:branched-chain amino acid transport system permease protein